MAYEQAIISPLWTTNKGFLNWKNTTINSNTSNVVCHQIHIRSQTSRRFQGISLILSSPISFYRGLKVHVIAFAFTTLLVKNLPTRRYTLASFSRDTSAPLSSSSNNENRAHKSSTLAMKGKTHKTVRKKKKKKKRNTPS